MKNFKALGVAFASIIGASVCVLNIYTTDAQAEGASIAAACKTGFKAGKTPVSLVVGAKPGCYDVKLAALGKKLLTGTGNTCFACHTPGGINPFNAMNSNLRAQGYTLAPASITAAFNAHSSEMLGAKMTAKDAKTISAFLQSIK